MRINPQQRPLETLRFAVDFAQMNLSDAPGPYVADVVRRLDAVFNPQRAKRIWHDVPPLNRATIARLQADALGMLTNIATCGFHELDLTLTFVVTRDLQLEMPLADARRAGLKTVSGYLLPQVLVLTHGAPRDWLMYRIIQLLEQVGADRLRVCTAPDCERLFVKVTRKEFCSTRCQSRFYMSERRKRERDERKASKGGRRGRTATRKR